MTHPAINPTHQLSLAKTPNQSIYSLDDVERLLQDSDCGSPEILVNFCELDRPLVSQEQLLFTVVEVAKILSLSRTKVYELLYSGQLASVKIGASRRVRRADLEQFVANLELAD